MFRAAPIDWLTALRDGLAHGVLIQEDDQFHQLARGFVGCNFVIDAVELVTAIVRGDDRPLVGRVTPRHLHDWLSREPATDEEVTPAALTEAGAVADFNDAPGAPWRRINAWVVLEAVLRRAAPEVSVAAPARGLFGQALAESVYRKQQQCGVRARQVVDAFDRWWAAFVPPVAGWLAPERWEGHAGRSWMDDDDLRRHLGEELLECFGTEHVLALAGLLRWKQWQVERCIQQLNGTLPAFPVEWDDLEELVAALDASRRARRPYRYRRGDVRALRAVVQWVEKASLSPAHGVKAERFTALLEGAAPAVEAEALEDHLGDWEALLRAARMRKLPPDWADHRPVEDLLTHPLPGELRFGGWRGNAQRYGLVK